MIGRPFLWEQIHEAISVKHNTMILRNNGGNLSNLVNVLAAFVYTKRLGCFTHITSAIEFDCISLSSQVPIYTPGWREAIIVKYLAQGHKCHDRDSNPHSGDWAPELEFNALKHSAMTLLMSLLHWFFFVAPLKENWKLVNSPSRILCNSWIELMRTWNCFFLSSSWEYKYNL